MIGPGSLCAALAPVTALVVGLVAFSELLTPLSKTQVRATMVATLKTLGIPADQWRPGGTYSTLLTVLAGAIATFLGLLAQGLGAGFLETASGGWLTILAYYVYGVTRPAATYATGQLTLQNAGGGVYSYSAGQATFSNSATGAQYTNSTGFTLAGFSTLTIPITATVAGASSSAAVPGAVNTLVTAMLGVTCSNPAPIVGLDAMGDPQLRKLCLDALAAMSVRGPRNAYAYAIQVAINPVTNAPVNINRWWISPASHQGGVTVYLASPSGVPDPNDVTGVRTAIQKYIRPQGVTVTVSAATGVAYGNVITVWAAAGPSVSAAALTTAVQTAVDAYLSGYPIGGMSKAIFFLWGSTPTGAALFASGVDGAIREAGPTIYAIDGTTDMPLQPGQVPLNETTVYVNVVTQGGSG